MPLYEYECQSCGVRFERIQKFSDPPLHTCQICGGELEQLLSAPAIQFKGSGWYVTDYARKTSSAAKSDTPPGEKSALGAKSGADSASKMTTETKPASKSSE